MSNSVQRIGKGSYVIGDVEYGVRLCTLELTSELMEAIGDEGSGELATHVYLAVERALQAAREEFRRQRIALRE